MSFEVGSIRLRELSFRITKGTTPTKGEGFVACGVNYIKSESITADGSIDASKFAFIDSKTHDKLARSQLRAGNVLFSMAGVYLGKTAVVLPEHLPANTNQAVGIVTLDESKADSYFIHYSLQSPACRAWVLRSAAQSAQPNFNLQEIGDLRIPAFPIERQKEIASVLRMLDDRIALLRETNATLEAIAQALFKSWFVDFDPVHAKQQGIAPEGMDEATAALFPDGFEESELGLVPKGWRVEPLTEVFDFREGPGIRNWQYTNSDQGTRFINIRCIQDGDLSIETANRITDEEANGKYAHFHLRAWDVVVSTSGTLGRSAIVRDEHLPMMLNTSVIRFQPLLNKMRFCFLYEYLNSPEFLYKLESMASGSVQKNFGPMHLKQMKLVCPSIDLLTRYESLCRPLFEEVVANRARIDTLATLRDTLLPRLISGQLRLLEQGNGGDFQESDTYVIAV